jgi:hypothetical protein
LGAGVSVLSREAKAVHGVVVVRVGPLQLVPVGGAQLARYLPLDWLAGAVDALNVAVVEVDGLGLGSASPRVFCTIKKMRLESEKL